MITSLSIENFALIDRLSIDFHSGFSTITGETGAGKSILLGALGLALGNRADLTSLKDKSRKCIIEATFRISDYGLQDVFDELGFDYDAETIIRREILPTGKSRAFVNDTPVNLQELQQLGNQLIDIHSQHETRELADRSYQFRIIDAVAGNSDLLRDYADKLKSYRDTQRQLDEAEQELARSQKEQDYNAFLLEELISANLREGEVQELESELAVLSNAGMITENFQKALLLSADENMGIHRNLREFRAALQKLASISDEYNLLSERTGSLLVEFDDIVSEIEKLSEKVNVDPHRLDYVNERLQQLSALMKKHQVASEEELISVRIELDEKLVSATEIENRIESLKNSLADLGDGLNRLGKQIHDKREAAIPALTGNIVEILSRLGMPHARFNITLNLTDRYSENGMDDLDFLFAANKGSDFGPLKKVASGGEMSRIMLAVKSILAQYQNLPTIIFDEIDTGVSGEVANAMGDIMKSMGLAMQVLSITHLPQIAAKGQWQYKVYKSVEGDQTHSSIVRLSDDERIEEIAKMLSGSTVSDSAITHARALLD